MQLNSTPVQVLPAKACNRCRLHGGIHAALGRSNSGTIIRLSRDRLSGRQAKQLKYVILSAATLSKTDQAAGTTSIPDTLRKYVAHVTVQGRQQPVHVYILGASHVSRQSCNHAAQVISATKPDIVLLELCKDRVDLLVDSSMPPPTHWHSRAVKLDSSFSQQSSFASTICTMLLERLKCRPGRPFAAYDIEQDCIQLLSSGMFASVTPSTQPASLSDAPMFVHDGNQVLSPPQPQVHIQPEVSAFGRIACLLQSFVSHWQRFVYQENPVSVA